MSRQRVLQELEALREELAKVASNGHNLQSEAVRRLSARIDELVLEYLRSVSGFEERIGN